MNRQAGRDIQSYHQDIVTKRVWIIPQICTIHRDGQREKNQEEKDMQKESKKVIQERDRDKRLRKKFSGLWLTRERQQRKEMQTQIVRLCARKNGTIKIVMKKRALLLKVSQKGREMMTECVKERERFAESVQLDKEIQRQSKWMYRERDRQVEWA